MKLSICQHCLVIPIHTNEKYCEACTEEMLNWLYAAEEQRLDDVEEQVYMTALEEKHSNFHYEER